MNEKEKERLQKRILAKISQKVNFTYPEGSPRKRLQGKLIDRVVMHTRSITQMKDFFDVIDYIHFNFEGSIKEAIRFGYYIYESDELRWGSQTTLTEEKIILLKLFRQAYRKPWFSEIIDECPKAHTNI